jgi:hypothetical protein
MKFSTLEKLLVGVGFVAIFGLQNVAVFASEVFDSNWQGQMSCDNGDIDRLKPMKKAATLKIRGARVSLSVDTSGSPFSLSQGKGEIEIEGGVLSKPGEIEISGDVDHRRVNGLTYSFSGQIKGSTKKFLLDGDFGPRSCKIALSKTNGQNSTPKARQASASSSDYNGIWAGKLHCGEGSKSRNRAFSRKARLVIKGTRVTLTETGGSRRFNQSSGVLVLMGPKQGEVKLQGAFEGRRKDFTWRFVGRVETGNSLRLTGGFGARECVITVNQAISAPIQTARASSSTRSAAPSNVSQRQDAARKAADAERQKLSQEIAALRKQQAEQATRQAAPKPKQPTLEQQLGVLKRLRDQGLLTPQEFDAKKQLLVNRFLGLSSQPTTKTASRTPSPSPASAIQTTLAKYADIKFGQYYALVIGSNNYKYLPKLATALGDAKAIAAVLQKSYGYKVKVLTDASRSDILDALDEYREKLTDNDNLLIYYAGHGWLDEASEQGYWLPVNAKPNRRTNWVSNADLTVTLKALNAKHVMVVADSCYSGTLVRGAKIQDNSPDYIRRMAEKRARLVITSGGLEPVADKGDSGHSPFASVFLDILKGNNGILDGTQLFNKMRRPVMLKADQTPEYSDVRKAGHEGGDFLFVRRR